MKYKIKIPKNLVNIYHCEAVILKNGKTKFIESKNYLWKKFEKKSFKNLCKHKKRGNNEND